MFRFCFVITLMISVNSFAAPAYRFFDSVHDVEHKRLLATVKIKVGVLNARNPKANVIYLHGFADTMDNHETLLRKFRDSNLNVIAYDFPGHGSSEGHIWAWDLKEVAMIINTIMKDSNVHFDRGLPVILAGWSTGATMAIRIMQNESISKASWKTQVLPNAHVIGLILYAPSVPANMTVGDSLIFPSIDTLTRNKACIKNDPQPTTTLGAGEFVASLKFQSEMARSGFVNLPKDLPILTIVAGDDDMYTTSGNTVKFVKAQAKQGVEIVGFQCTDSYHAIDCEPSGIAEESTDLAVNFAKAIAADPVRRVQNTSAFKSVTGIACPRVK